jgi:glycosyltransferase involved in cell wall biosynthesis
MNDKYRFVYTTETDLSVENGPGINEREFVDALIIEYGDQVRCIIPYPQYPDNYFNPSIEYVLPFFSKPYRYPFFLCALLVRILKLERTNQFDALAFRLGILPIVPLLSCLLLKKPIFLKTLAGYYAFEKEDRNWKRKVLAAITFPFYKAIVQRALAADTVSIPYIKWLFSKYGIKKESFQVIPNGANTDYFCLHDKSKYRKQFGLDHFSKIVGYVGALDSLRHIEDLILSIKRINTAEKIGLVLVGTGEDQDKYKKLANSIGLDEKVIFTGKVPYDDVPKIMNTFDVGVDLSLIPMRVDEIIHNASYSQKIPQYLSCGLPVVAWKTDDTMFLREEGIGDVAEVGNAKELDDVIMGQLSINNSSCNTINKSRNYAVSNFSNKVLSEKRINFWESSLNNVIKKN